VEKFAKFPGLQKTSKPFFFTSSKSLVFFFNSLLCKYIKPLTIMRVSPSCKWKFNSRFFFLNKKKCEKSTRVKKEWKF
jgi:hypothetical protein